MDTLTYYVALAHKEKGTAWGILFPDFPGCISAGDTFDRAMAGATEALAGHIAVMREYGDAVPGPRSLEVIRASRKFENELKGAIVAMVPLLPQTHQPVTISVSIDKALLDALDQHAEGSGRTRSALLAEGAHILLRARTLAVHGKKPKGGATSVERLTASLRELSDAVVDEKSRKRRRA
jgi:predicted RNase H-like HicB family nuclease